MFLLIIDIRNVLSILINKNTTVQLPVCTPYPVAWVLHLTTISLCRNEQEGRASVVANILREKFGPGDRDEAKEGGAT